MVGVTMRWLPSAILLSRPFFNKTLNLQLLNFGLFFGS